MTGTDLNGKDPLLVTVGEGEMARMLRKQGWTLDEAQAAAQQIMARSSSELPDTFFALRRVERRQLHLKRVVLGLGALLVLAALAVFVLLTPWTPDRTLQALKFARYAGPAIALLLYAFYIWRWLSPPEN